MKINKALDFMIKNKIWNKFLNFGLLILASLNLTGAILTIVDGTSNYPAFSLLIALIFFGLIVKIK